MAISSSKFSLSRILGALRPRRDLPVEAGDVHRMPVASGASYWGGGYHEGAMASRTRQLVYLPELDSFEIADYALSELWKKAEYLHENNGVVRRLTNGSVRYSVGRGIVPAAKTEDKEWNREIETRFDDWSRNPNTFDVSARYDFFQSQRAMASGMMRIGDAFGQTTSSSSGDSPMMQFFEGSRIHGMAHEARGKTKWQNGVKLNRLNRPLGYAVFRDRSSKPAFLPVDRALHVWDPERIRGSRGLPWASHAITKMWDWKEIAAAATAGVKLDQLQGLLIKRNDAVAATADLQSRVNGSGGSGSSFNDANKRFEEFFGAMANHYLEPNEDVASFASDRPHERLTKWLDYLVRDAAHGFGISPELAWNLAGVGGAPMRWILADGQRFFEEVQEILKLRYCRRVWTYFVAWQIRDGFREPAGKKPWWSHAWITPQQVTVDRTKDGKLEIELIKNALNSVPRYYRALGLDFEDVVLEQLDFLEWLAAECEKRDGVCMEQLIAPHPNQSVAFQVDSNDPDN